MQSQGSLPPVSPIDPARLPHSGSQPSGPLQMDHVESSYAIQFSFSQQALDAMNVLRTGNAYEGEQSPAQSLENEHPQNIKLSSQMVSHVLIDPLTQLSQPGPPLEELKRYFMSVWTSKDPICITRYFSPKELAVSPSGSGKYGWIKRFDDERESVTQAYETVVRAIMGASAFPGVAALQSQIASIDEEAKKKALDAFMLKILDPNNEDFNTEKDSVLGSPEVINALIRYYAILARLKVSMQFIGDFQRNVSTYIYPEGIQFNPSSPGNIAEQNKLFGERERNIDSFADLKASIAQFNANPSKVSLMDLQHLLNLAIATSALLSSEEDPLEGDLKTLIDSLPDVINKAKKQWQARVAGKSFYDVALQQLRDAREEGDSQEPENEKVVHQALRNWLPHEMSTGGPHIAGLEAPPSIQKQMTHYMQGDQGEVARMIALTLSRPCKNEGTTLYRHSQKVSTQMEQQGESDYLVHDTLRLTPAVNEDDKVAGSLALLDVKIKYSRAKDQTVSAIERATMTFQNYEEMLRYFEENTVPFQYKGSINPLHALDGFGALNGDESYIAPSARQKALHASEGQSQLQDIGDAEWGSEQRGKPDSLSKKEAQNQAQQFFERYSVLRGITKDIPPGDGSEELYKESWTLFFAVEQLQMRLNSSTAFFDSDSRNALGEKIAAARAALDGIASNSVSQSLATLGAVKEDLASILLAGYQSSEDEAIAEDRLDALLPSAKYSAFYAQTSVTSFEIYCGTKRSGEYPLQGWQRALKDDSFTKAVTASPESLNAFMDQIKIAYLNYAKKKPGSKADFFLQSLNDAALDSYSKALIDFFSNPLGAQEARWLEYFQKTTRSGGSVDLESDELLQALPKVAQDFFKAFATQDFDKRAMESCHALGQKIIRGLPLSPKDPILGSNAIIRANLDALQVKIFESQRVLSDQKERCLKANPLRRDQFSTVAAFDKAIQKFCTEAKRVSYKMSDRPNIEKIDRALAAKFTQYMEDRKKAFPDAPKGKYIHRSLATCKMHRDPNPSTIHSANSKLKAAVYLMRYRWWNQEEIAQERKKEPSFEDLKGLGSKSFNHLALATKMAEAESSESELPKASWMSLFSFSEKREPTEKQKEQRETFGRTLEKKLQTSFAIQQKASEYSNLDSGTYSTCLKHWRAPIVEREKSTGTYSIPGIEARYQMQEPGILRDRQREGLSLTLDPALNSYEAIEALCFEKDAKIQEDPSPRSSSSDLDTDLPHSREESASLSDLGPPPPRAAQSLISGSLSSKKVQPFIAGAGQKAGKSFDSLDPESKRQQRVAQREFIQAAVQAVPNPMAVISKKCNTIEDLLQVLASMKLVQGAKTEPRCVFDVKGVVLSSSLKRDVEAQNLLQAWSAFNKGNDLKTKSPEEIQNNYQILEQAFLLYRNQKAAAELSSSSSRPRSI